MTAQIQNPRVWLQNFELHPNNNILERLNETLRERTRDFRSREVP